MPEALIPLAGSIIGGLTSKKSSSTPATQTASKDPWAPAQPWMLENIKQGQALQCQYQANPFSDLQKNSYSNQFQNTDQMRSLAQQLLGGLGKPQAFDRNNPSVKPTLPFDLSALFQAQQARQAQPASATSHAGTAKRSIRASATDAYLSSASATANALSTAAGTASNAATGCYFTGNDEKD